MQHVRRAQQARGTEMKSSFYNLLWVTLCVIGCFFVSMSLVACEIGACAVWVCGPKLCGLRAWSDVWNIWLGLMVLTIEILVRKDSFLMQGWNTIIQWNYLNQNQERRLYIYIETVLVLEFDWLRRGLSNHAIFSTIYCLYHSQRASCQRTILNRNVQIRLHLCHTL